MSLFSSRLPHASIISALLLTTLSAQTAPGPDSGTADSTVVLPEFAVKVDKDNGYLASDTISGSRLSTNLLRTPSDVSVLTREFLADLGIIDTRDALRWLTSSYPTDPNTDPRDFGGNVTFRGLPAGANTRNYFPYIITVKDYLVDRIEGWRGPNSILYGVGPAGGSVNILTKQALFKSSGALDVRGDTAGSTRMAVDVNEPLGSKVAVRVNALSQRRRNWIDGYFNDTDAVDIAVSARPWKGATFRFDGEYGLDKNSMSYVPLTDRSSAWDQQTVATGPLAASPAASTGLVRLTTSYLVASNAFDGVLSFLNYPRTDGTSLSLANGKSFTGFPVLPRKQFWAQPAQAKLKSDYYTAQAFYEQTFDSGLVTELAFSTEQVIRKGPTFNWTSTYLDVVKVLPNGAANPHFGEYYSETPLNNFYRTLNYETTARAAAAYPIQFGRNTQTFSVVAQRDFNNFDPQITLLARDNNPADANLRSAANAYVYRQYWSAPQADLKIPTDSNGYHFSETRTRSTHQAAQMSSIQLNTVGAYFANKVTLIAGVRYDDYKAHVRDIATFDSRGYAATYSDQRFGAKVTTTTAGLTYFPVNTVGLYVNYADGFRPLNRNVPALPGEPGANATSSNSRTAGLRLNLWDGRVVGSIGYYEAEETGQTQQLSLGVVNQIWVDIGQPDKQITPTAYLDTYDYRAHGFEADLTANVTKSLRVKFNLALPETEQSNSYPGSNAYIAQNLAAWQAGAADVTNPNRARVASNTATYLNTIQSAIDGRTLNGTVKWTANVFGTYTFTSGKLNGFQIGGGANIYGKRLIGNQLNQPTNFVYAEAYTVANAMAAYKFKVRRFPCEVRLNVTNLFDYSDEVYTSVAIYQGRAYRNNYYYIPARETMLTLSLKW